MQAIIVGPGNIPEIEGFEICEVVEDISFSKAIESRSLIRDWINKYEIVLLNSEVAPGAVSAAIAVIDEAPKRRGKIGIIREILPYIEWLPPDILVYAQEEGQAPIWLKYCFHTEEINLNDWRKTYVPGLTHYSQLVHYYASISKAPIISYSLDHLYWYEYQ